MQTMSPKKVIEMNWYEAMSAEKAIVFQLSWRFTLVLKLRISCTHVQRAWTQLTIKWTIQTNAFANNKTMLHSFEIIGVMVLFEMEFCDHNEHKHNKNNNEKICHLHKNALNYYICMA